MEQCLSIIQYYIREGFWNTVIYHCNQELNKGSEPQILFWRAFSYYKQGSISDAIQELEQIHERRETHYAATIALLYYHSMCSVPDQEAIDRLQYMAPEDEKTAPEKGLTIVAQFFMHLEEFTKAKKVVDRLLEMNQNSGRVHCLDGWLDLITGNFDPKPTKAKFDMGVKELGKNLDVQLGRAKFFEKAKKFGDALNILNECTALFPNIIPPLSEKAKLLILMSDWDQSHDTIQKIFSLEKLNIEALRIWTFLLLAREGNYKVAKEKIRDLMRSFDVNEPKNPDLYFKCSQLFSRVAGGNTSIIQLTIDMLKRCQAMSPLNPTYITELGYQHTLLGEFTTAFQVYQKAAEYDDGSEPLYGMIFCRIKQNLLEDAEQQLEFSQEMLGGQKTAIHAFLEAMYTWRKLKDLNESCNKLSEALSLHIAETKKLPFGFEFYIKLNSAFLLELAREYLQHMGMTPLPTGSKPPKYMDKGIKLLGTLTKQTPGILDAHLLLAKSQWIVNDLNAAQTVIANCIEMNSENVTAFILSAIINSDAGNFKAAHGSLEQAISHNFKVRENPLFMSTKARLEIQSGDVKQALVTLEAAFVLPVVKVAPKGKKSHMGTSEILHFGEEERADIFIMLIDAYTRLERVEDARKILKKAIAEFAGTKQEVKILLTNSDIALKQGDLKKAISMLKKIPEDSLHYKAAKMKMATIYLEHLLDRRLFTKQYLDILAQEKSVENYRLVAKALMKIQDPETAIQYYEQAVQESQDSSLVRDIGHALVMTHDYQKAITYYKQTISVDPKQHKLREDLGRLYLKLKAYNEAKQILNEGLELLQNEEDENSVHSMKAFVGFHVLLARVLIEEKRSWKVEAVPKAKEGFIKAIEIQSRVIDRRKEMRSEKEYKEKDLGSEINYMLGEYFELRENNLEQAQYYYQESLSYNQAYKKALFAIAKLFMRKDERDQSMTYCRKILKLEPSNEEAAFMLADVMLLKEKTEAAIGVFRDLLNQEPTNFKALSQILVLLRRSGKLEEAPGFIEVAEKAATNSIDPGLCYAKGMHYRYIGEIDKALQEFNRARTDGKYGKNALIAMIELYLNPDDDILWCSNTDKYKANIKYIQAAEELTKELATREEGDPAVVIAECYCQMYRKQKNSLEKADAKLKEMLEQRKDYVPALRAMAVCKMLQKKKTDARNLLKRLESKPYQTEFADDFEHGWILLADLFVGVSKNDLAEKLCLQCLKFNKSQLKAEELMGLVKEKENTYVEAANHYNKAWQLSKQSSASIGFRLAFNHLKAHRYVDCIDVCKQILKKFPGYPQIEGEILQKAINSLRS